MSTNVLGGPGCFERTTRCWCHVDPQPVGFACACGCRTVWVDEEPDDQETLERQHAILVGALVRVAGYQVAFRPDAGPMERALALVGGYERCRTIALNALREVDPALADRLLAERVPTPTTKGLRDPYPTVRASKRIPDADVERARPDNRDADMQQEVSGCE